MDTQNVPVPPQDTGIYLLSKTDSITLIVEKSPKAVELLIEYGIACTNCVLKQFDTLEIGAQLHGMSDDEIETMVDEINDVLRKDAKGN
jgi:hypothetical protein